MRKLAVILALGVLAAWTPFDWPWHTAEAALLFYAAWRSIP
jgi:hypothetical protein